MLQVTIWLGVFPIVVSWWAALGLTVYFIATNMVLYYIKSLKHIEALWFANCANQLLFYTYIKVRLSPCVFCVHCTACCIAWQNRFTGFCEPYLHLFAVPNSMLAYAQ